MKHLAVMIALAVAALSLVAFAAPANASKNEFVGAKACSKCHKKDKDGEQFAIWEKSDHAKAFETLGTPKAKEAATKVGVSGDPQKSEACLICHTTGADVAGATFDKKFKVEDGVQCESCHGAGDEYKSKKVMKKIAEERGPDGKGNSPTAKETGLIFPDENSCKTCHAQERTVGGKTFKNPSYKDFDFKKRWEKIKHPKP